MDEYNPELHYVESSSNVLADKFSQLLWNDSPASPVVGKKQPSEDNNDKSYVDETPLDNYFSWTDDREMLDCFTYLPDKE
jgi:hypothetical protein